MNSNIKSLDTFHEVRDDIGEAAIFHAIVSTMRSLRAGYSADDIAAELTNKAFYILSQKHYDSIVEAVEPLLSGYHTYQELAHAILDNIDLY